MKSQMLKTISVLTLGLMIITGAVPVNATMTGVNAGICKTIADTASVSTGSSLSAGISSALSSCIDVSTAKATISEVDAEITAAGQEQLIAGYTNLGIASVEGNLNIREGASTETELVGKLPKDAGCEILGIEGEWTRIESGEVTGYVKSEYLMTGKQARKYAPSVMSTIATCTADTLRVRKEPNTECDIIALMPNGEEVEVVENLGDWIKVSVDSEEGYVSADYVSVSNQLKKAMTMTEVKYGEGISDVCVDLVSYACQFVGNPYVWGGTSLTRGADCSGFTLSVFAKYGVYLPHSSAAQANYGRRVSAGEAKPGDLFFYGSGKRISHVAIYIGNGQIVHASSARTGIKISNAYYRSPICVTRLLN